PEPDPFAAVSLLGVAVRFWLRLCRSGSSAVNFKCRFQDQGCGFSEPVWRLISLPVAESRPTSIGACRSGTLNDSVEKGERDRLARCRRRPADGFWGAYA